jgi:3-deoxy-D-manno-octulosonate 8-phosphate phosphatase (KDO 8-P phosphatase)
MPVPAPERLAQLQGLILDCDGVLTPGDLFYDEAGRRLLRFDTKDGFGLALLCKAFNLPVSVLSGRATDIAERRLRELGIREFRSHCRDKAAGFVELCEHMGVAPAQCGFVGDDLPDLPAFAHAGLTIAVADAAPEVRAAADWVTTMAGGRGAVREVCEAILKARGDWQAWLAQQPVRGGAR